MSSYRLFVPVLAGCWFSGSKANGKCPRGTDSESTKTMLIKAFFEDKTAHNKGVKILDPLVVENVQVLEKTENVKTLLKDFKVTGFKDVVVSKISEEKDTDLVHYTLKFDVIAEGPVKLEFLKQNKALSGIVKYKGGATGTISQTCTSKAVNGMDVYEMGPETVTCECNDVTATYSDELRTALDHSLNVQNVDNESVRREYNNKVMCEIALVVFKAAVDNLRTKACNGDR